jgi:hypothetical protein
VAVVELFAGSRREVLMGKVPPAGCRRRAAATRRSLAIQSPSMAPAPRETGRGAHPDGSMLIGPPIRSTCAPKSTGSADVSKFGIIR